jgi:hypothetical protein
MQPWWNPCIPSTARSQVHLEEERPHRAQQHGWLRAPRAEEPGQECLQEPARVSELEGIVWGCSDFLGSRESLGLVMPDSPHQGKVTQMCSVWKLPVNKVS